MGNKKRRQKRKAATKKKRPAVFGKRPKLSLCMIVRDEEAMLPGCLASVKGLVDEVIVVDTGSEDATKAIAEAAGARILERAWDDDFAAARNHGLEAATGDWVLVLDADERLADGAADAIRKAVRRGGFDCGLLPFHNAGRLDATPAEVLSGEARNAEISYIPRLLRRTGGLRYEGIIHESVQTWLLERKSKPRILEGADVLHYGYVATVQEQRDKRARNHRLLEAAIERKPDDVTAYGYLAISLLDSGELERALEVAKTGARRLPPPGPGNELHGLRLSVTRAWVATRQERLDEALAAVAKGMTYWNNHPDLWFLHGCAARAKAFAAESLADREHWLEEAVAAFQLCMRQHGELHVQRLFQGATTWAAQTHLGTLFLMRHQWADARRCFELAIEAGDPRPDPLLGLVECLIGQGDAAEATQRLEPYMDDHPDGWLLAALAAERIGAIQSVIKLLRETQKRAERGYRSPHRRERFVDLFSAIGIHLNQPNAGAGGGPVGLLARLLDGDTVPVETSTVRPLDEDMVHRVLRARLLAGDAEALGRLVLPQANAALPGIRRAVELVVVAMEREATAKKAS